MLCCQPHLCDVQRMQSYAVTLNISADQAEGLTGDITAVLVGASGTSDEATLTWPAELESGKALVAGSATVLTLLCSDVGKVSQLTVKQVRGGSGQASLGLFRLML